MLNTYLLNSYLKQLPALAKAITDYHRFGIYRGDYKVEAAIRDLELDDYVTYRQSAAEYIKNMKEEN